MIRDGGVVYEGEVSSLKRFKDDVREVKEGFECGIGIANFNDVKVGDVIETYRVEEFARTLPSRDRAEGSFPAVVVTVSTWDLLLPGAASLKEKRSVVRSLKDRLGRMNVSVVESGLQDQRNRAVLSVAFLAAHNSQADSVLASVDRLVADARGVRVAGSSVERF